MNDIAVIKLTRGLITLVDAEDYEMLSVCKWCANWQARNFYAQNGSRGLLHRFLMKPPRKMNVDHINHNTLDNRKINLRIVTPSQNSLNRVKGRGGITYRGDQFDKPWRVRLYVGEYKRIHIGVFTTREEAEEALRHAYTDRRATGYY